MQTPPNTIASFIGGIAFLAIGLFFLISLIKGHGVHGAADYITEKAEWLARIYEGNGGQHSRFIWCLRSFSVIFVVVGLVESWRRGLIRSNISAFALFALASLGILVWYWFMPHRAVKHEATNVRLMASMVCHVPWLVPFLTIVTLLFGIGLIMTAVQNVFING